MGHRQLRGGGASKISTARRTWCGDTKASLAPAGKLALQDHALSHSHEEKRLLHAWHRSILQPNRPLDLGRLGVGHHHLVDGTVQVRLHELVSVEGRLVRVRVWVKAWA